MTVIIKPIKRTDTIEPHYREFENVEFLEDAKFPLIRLRNKDHKSYIAMNVPNDCYLLVILED